MSQENVEIVRHVYELFNAGDPAWIDELAEDVEIDERVLAPDTGVYRGHEGVRRWAGKALEAFEPARYEVQRWIDGDDVVVTDLILHARGVSSGVRTTTRLGHLVRVRQEKIVYLASFPTVEDALEAAGLSE